MNGLSGESSKAGTKMLEYHYRVRYSEAYNRMNELSDVKLAGTRMDTFNDHY